MQRSVIAHQMQCVRKTNDESRVHKSFDGSHTHNEYIGGRRFFFYFFFFRSVGRSADRYARMIYGGCFYHTVSGFVIILKPAGQNGAYSDDDGNDDIVRSGGDTRRYDRNQIGVNHCSRLRTHARNGVNMYIYIHTHEYRTEIWRKPTIEFH